MILTEVTDESKCCCSCRNNIRTHDKMWGCVCHCDKDGHYIGYVENFTQVCEEWETMRDYIERQAAIDAVRERLKRTPTLAIVTMDAVEKIKPADVAPVVHGKWIYDGHHRRCDKCGTYFCNADREGDAIPDNFCPNCGAKMDAQGEE